MVIRKPKVKEQTFILSSEIPDYPLMWNICVDVWGNLELFGDLSSLRISPLKGQGWGLVIWNCLPSSNLSSLTIRPTLELLMENLKTLGMTKLEYLPPSSKKKKLLWTSNMSSPRIPLPPELELPMELLRSVQPRIPFLPIINCRGFFFSNLSSPRIPSSLHLSKWI